MLFTDEAKKVRKKESIENSRLKMGNESYERHRVQLLEENGARACAGD